jgi:prophage regulatory protein
MVDRPKGPIVPWLADRLGEPRDAFLGMADIARRLGVTRQRIAQIRRDDPTFPRSFSAYGRTRAWLRSGVELWAAAHRPSARKAGGRFRRNAASLLLAAEAHAERLDVGWIDSGLIWLAVASGDAGSGLQLAAQSMGLTVADVEDEIRRWRGTDDRPTRARRLNPRVQGFLSAADRRVAEDGRRAVQPLDILLAFIDAKRERYGGGPPRSPDHVLDVFERRGLDIIELRRRLVAADASPRAAGAFEQRRLKRLRVRTPSSKAPRLQLARNPLGHDPWTRWPWGAAFAVTRDGRHLKVDGEVWFFKIDGDGYYIRSPDGRPIGYRYRMEPPPRLRRGQTFIKPVNGFEEVLPMPPVEMADWPDRRFERDD